MKTKIFKIDLSKDLKLEAGEGQAIIATLNVEDHDGDVILPGAIGKEQHGSILPAHDRSQASMGKVVITEVDGKLLASFKFNLNQDHKTAREWYAALKFDRENGLPVQEWSFSLNNVVSKQGPFGESNRQVNFIERFDISEISPVLRAASIGTQTVSIKEKENQTFKEEMEKVVESLAETKAIIERTRTLAEMRAKDGRSLTEEKQECLKSIDKSLDEISEGCKSLLFKVNENANAVDKLHAEYQHIVFTNRDNL